MNQGEFERQVTEMTDKLPNELLAECIHILNASRLSRRDFPDDFVLPPIILRIALERKAEQIAPDHWLNSQYRQIYNNLKRF